MGLWDQTLSKLAATMPTTQRKTVAQQHAGLHAGALVASRAQLHKLQRPATAGHETPTDVPTDAPTAAPTQAPTPTPAPAPHQNQPQRQCEGCARACDAELDVFREDCLQRLCVRSPLRRRTARRWTNAKRHERRAPRGDERGPAAPHFHLGMGQPAGLNEGGRGHSKGRSCTRR